MPGAAAPPVPFGPLESDARERSFTAGHSTRDEALRARLDELKDHWLRIQCDPRAHRLLAAHIVYFAGKMLLKDRWRNPAFGRP